MRGSAIRVWPEPTEEDNQDGVVEPEEDGDLSLIPGGQRWPVGILAKAKGLRVSDTSDVAYIGLYNALLNFAFNTTESFYSVVPSFPPPGSDVENMPPASFTVEHRDRVVFVLQITPPADLEWPERRIEAERYMLQLFNDAIPATSAQTIHGASAMGKWLSYYEFSDTGGYWSEWKAKPVIKTPKPDSFDDISPEKRWETNILTVAGREKFFEIVGEVKKVVDGLHIKKLEFDTEKELGM